MFTGRTTRAQLTNSIRAAPARRSARAQALAVLPVVKTSSTKTTVLPRRSAAAFQSIDLLFKSRKLDLNGAEKVGHSFRGFTTATAGAQ